MPDKPIDSDMTVAELEELLDQPETPEEKAALDALARDPELILKLARRRAAQADEPPKL